jgi:hypothetical protein
VRKPFSVSAVESGDATTMQMPPFMRNSNAFPMTLADWQYRLLMAWKDDLLASGLVAEGRDEGGGPLSTVAARRRRDVLELLAKDDR